MARVAPSRGACWAPCPSRMRVTTWATPSPRPPTTTQKCVSSAHTLTYTQRGTSIDGEHLTLTKGVPSALVIEDACYHIEHIFAETSNYHT